jgi:hypothetical protein
MFMQWHTWTQGLEVEGNILRELYYGGRECRRGKRCKDKGFIAAIKMAFAPQTERKSSNIYSLQTCQPLDTLSCAMMKA